MTKNPPETFWEPPWGLPGLLGLGDSQHYSRWARNGTPLVPNRLCTENLGKPPEKFKENALKTGFLSSKWTSVVPKRHNKIGKRQP